MQGEALLDNTDYFMEGSVKRERKASRLFAGTHDFSDTLGSFLSTQQLHNSKMERKRSSAATTDAEVLTVIKKLKDSAMHPPKQPRCRNHHDFLFDKLVTQQEPLPFTPIAVAPPISVPYPLHTR